MFQLIEQLHLISTKHNLKLAPENFLLFFMFSKLNFLDMKLITIQSNLYTLKLMQFIEIPLLVVKLPL